MLTVSLRKHSNLGLAYSISSQILVVAAFLVHLVIATMATKVNLSSTVHPNYVSYTLRMV